MRRIFSLLILLTVVRMVSFAVGGDIVIDPTVKNYFVKTESSGTGDGKTWADAMSGEMFAQYLPLVGNGVTFHLAKGDYMPPSSDDLISNAEDAGLGYVFEVSYSVKSKVAIIGGYPEEPDDNSTPDYKKNVTRFVPSKLSGNQHFFEISPNSRLSLSHVYLDGNDFTIRSPFYVRDAALFVENAVISDFDAGYANGATCVGAWLKEDCELSFDNVLFNGNTSSHGDAAGFIHYDKSATESVSFTNCSFENNSCSIASSSLLYLQGENNSCIFERCSFYKNKYLQGNLIFSDGGYLEVVNSTFYGNTAKSSDLLYSPSGCQSSFSYNTIIQDVDSENELIFLGGNSNMSLFNNIILNWSDGAFYSTNAIAELSSSQNLVSNRSSETDILIGTEISDILDGGAVGGVWTPNLDYHGGLTKSVALKADALKDGTSIRVTKTRRDPDIDQRGYPRMKSTCVGAYEMCEQVTAKAYDAIALGESFMGKKYTVVGQYTDILEHSLSMYGCDSVTNHTLSVLPSPDVTAYYVKMNGEGDGSSWDDALSPKMFDYVLKNLTADNVTFYIAAGDYLPYYNGNGQEANDRTRRWATKHAVTLIGGFPANSTGKVKATDVPDVKKNPTILNGDYDGDDRLVVEGCSFTIENITNDINGSLLTIDMSENGGVTTLSNLILTGVRDPKGSPSTVSVWGKKDAKDKLVLNRCEIKLTEKGVSTYDLSELVIEECEFNYILNNAVYTDAVCSVNKTTFNHCSLALELAATEGVNWLTNSTFVANRVDFVCASIFGSPVGNVVNRFYNNTFISCDGKGSSTLKGDRSYYLYGNIFAGSSLYFEKVASPGSSVNLEVANNVLACGVTNLTLDDSNIITTREEIFDGVLDVTYSKATDIVQANLVSESGATPTVALLKDKLSDESSLRFPRIESVLTDQRGEDRLESTCMGAYEKPCEEDEKEVSVTILVGEEFHGKVYSSVGRFIVKETEKNDIGCESVVNYTLTVKPKGLNYYVKMKGTGDGSSWKEAMNGDDFATYLPIVPDGSTFYVAEGTYSPIYGEGFTSPDKSSDLCYEVNSKVTIIGGYPNSAIGDEPSEPYKYETIFNGDIKGDNKEVSNGSYIAKITYENYEDNIKTLFAQYSDLSLYGLKIKGCFVPTYYPWGPISMKKEDLRLNLQCVDFTGNNTCINGSVGSETLIDSCRFQTNIGCGNNGGAITNKGSLHVKNTSFISCNTCFDGGAIYSPQGGYVFIENSSFENCYSDNYGSAICVMKCQEFKSVNSTYVANYSRSGTIYVENVGDCKLYNNTLISNAMNPSADEENGLALKGTETWSMIGNIIGGIEIPGNNSDFDKHTRDNIIIEGTGIAVTETNTIIPYSECPIFLDGQYDSENDWFVARMAENNGFTRTVKLLKDKISEDIDVRFPRLENVLSDQRGVSRREMACKGAYEIPCVEDVKEVSETIFVGEEFHGKVYSSVGRFFVTETEKDDLGCESVVNYTLTVKPKGLNYYVKMNGTGDGSSWKEAMNGDDFANHLPMVPDGATFHVAAGRYSPIMDKNFETVDNLQYTINSSVNIIGGYSPDAETGAVPDPIQYKTVFTGDPKGDDYFEEDSHASNYVVIKDPSHDDLDILVLFDAGGVHDLSFSGCVFSGVTSSYGEENLNVRQESPIYCKNLDLSYCTFETCGTIMSSANTKMTADYCIFRNRTSVSSPSSSFDHDDIYITNSLLEDMAGSSGGNFERVSNVVNIKNTVLNNFINTSDVFTRAKELYLYNNLFLNMKGTAVNDYLLSVPDKAEIVGNMFKNCDYKNLVGSTENAVVKHNLCENIKGTENDIETTDLADYLIDGEFNATTSKFVPVFADWGGYVPTVVTKADKLPDGTSIRFPLGETIVETDQRGVDRLSSTCMGVYEIPCVGDVQEATDTIIVGESFNGVVYDHMGRYDNIEVKTVNEQGCENTVIYTLYVDPDPTRLNYYVKIERWNAGNGWRWEDAMDGADFAYCLPRAPEGAKFFIAEGEYQPIYDESKETPAKTSDLTYRINGCVSIYGGFDNYAVTGAVSDPSKYHTVFNGDISKDDEIDETLDSDGFPLLTKAHREDNVSSMFSTLNEDPHDLLFDGIVVVNAKNTFNILFNDKHVTLSRDSFAYNDKVVQMPFNGCTMNVSNTSFYRNDECMFMPNVDIVSMDSVRFVNNKNTLLYVTKSEDFGDVQMDHVTALSNSSSVGFDIYKYNVDIKNSLFKENNNSDLFHVSGNNTTVAFSGSRFEENTGSCVILNETTSNLYVDDCNFIGNHSSSYLINHRSVYDHLYLTNSSFKENESQADLIYALSDIMVVDSVIFDHNKQINIICGQSIPNSKITNNIFSNNECKQSVETGQSSIIFFNATKNLESTTTAVLERNTFMRNTSEHVFTSTIKSLALINNTIVTNEAKRLFYVDGTNLELYNNTIIGNSVGETVIELIGAPLNMIGNIMVGNVDPSGKNTERIWSNYGSFEKISSNILPAMESLMSNCTFIPDKSNIVSLVDPSKSSCTEFQSVAGRNKAILTTLFDGTYDDATGLFTPVLEYKGGFSPVAPLKTTMIDPNTSIRFERLGTVLEDQVHQSRNEQTCMGAYEYVDFDWEEMCADPVLIFREDFGEGDPEFAYSKKSLKEGFTSLIHQPNYPLAVDMNGYHSAEKGCYDIRKTGYHRVENGLPYSGWYMDFDDHTSPNNIKDGCMMQVDMADGPGVFYNLTMNHLCENTHLYLSVWGHPVNKDSNTKLKLSVMDSQGNHLVKEPVDVTIDASLNEWQQFVLYFTVPKGHTEAVFRIYSDGGNQGNDFALDDIEVYLCKPSVQVTAPEGVLCEGGSYSLSAAYDKAELGGYIAPVEYTWFKNEGDPNDIDSWEKVSTGSDLSFSSFSSKDDGYYRCVISSNGVEAELDNCNSMSEPIELRASQSKVDERIVTIFPGEQYDGALYFLPGVYDIYDKTVNENGCEETMITHLVVRELRSEYYVKTERSLKGDGSDWDNAMNGYDFAQVLPHVKDGTTFYIADGTYHPYFNSNGVESTGVDRHYVAKAAINIVGGYSPEATGDASTTTPDPFTYHTVLSGDFKDDDVWTVDGCGMVHDENVDVDNLKGESLMLVDMSKRGGKSSFKNVEFTGMRSGNGSPSLLTVHGYNGVGSVESNGLEVYRCTFSQAYSGISSSKVSDVNVSQCEISKLLFSGISVNYADKSILVDRTTLSYCGGYGLVFNDNKAEIKVRNSTLVNNRTDYSNTRNTGSINVFNNTFLSCQGAQDVLVGSSMNYNFVGNIFASGAMNPVVDGDENGNVTSICNIYVGFTPTFNGEKDVLASRAALPSFLEGQASATSFVPTLKRNDGGFTTTVAVTSPSFVNGAEMSTIRFAMSNMLEKIKIDETGKVRLYNTCMGAYEYIGNLCDDPYYSITFTSNPVTKESHSVDLVVPYDEVPTLMLMDTEGEVISKGWYNWYSISAVEENKYKIEFNMATLRSKKLDPLTPFVLIVKQGDKYVKIAYMYVSRI